MNPSPTLLEKRIDERTSRSEAILWRDRPDGEFQMGWLLESSDVGFAFAWRGPRPPSVNSIIDIHLDPREAAGPHDSACIKRVQLAHDDLLIIAAEKRRPTRTRPFLAG